MAQRVLVVEDDPVQARLLKACLEPLDLDWLEAKTPKCALALLKDCGGLIDLILLDRQFPQGDGIEFLRELKHHPQFERIPVVMQTAIYSDRDVREGLAAGASYYLSKPLEPTLLLAIARRALDESAQWRSTKSHRRSALIAHLCEAEFSFRTLSDARELAAELSFICPEPDKVGLGLLELMINAVEHGNLEISYEEKSKLCRADGWQAEVERRLALPEYLARRAYVRVKLAENKVRFVVRDQGQGFSWSRFLDVEPERAFEPNGRGISLARRIAFSDLRYSEPGNLVEADVELETSA